MDALVQSLNCTLIELPDDGCRYIEGDDHLFCGMPAEPGKPYCAAHCLVCYQSIRENLRFKNKPHYAAAIRKAHQPAVTILGSERFEDAS